MISLILSFLVVSSSSKVLADKENYWVWDLGGGTVAYTSLAEDIRFGKEINAMKRLAGGESAGFPKISISTQQYEKIKDTWEKNGKDYIRNYKGLTWPAGKPAHWYAVTTDPEGTNRMQSNNVEIRFMSFDVMSEEYFGEVHNITANGSVLNYGHSITLLAAETMGSIFVQQGSADGPFPINRNAMYFSTTFVSTSATDLWNGSSKWLTASQKWYMNPQMVRDTVAKATDEDTPKVDDRSVEPTSQVDKNSLGTDSTGTAWKFSEDMIPNMPKDRDFKDDITTMKFLTPDKLEKAETLSVVKWQEEVENDITDMAITKVRIGFTTLGLVFILIGGFLILFYTFDRWAWGVSSIAFFTGGRVRITNGVENASVVTENGKRIKIINFTDVVIWSGIFTLIGVLAISGQLYQFLSWVSEWKWLRS